MAYPITTTQPIGQTAANPATGQQAPYGVLPNANAWFGSFIPQPFPGTAVAGFTPLQQESWLRSQNALRQSMPAARQLEGAAQNLLGGYQAFAQNPGLDPQFNPFRNPELLRAISEANKVLSRDFHQGVLPQIRQGAVAAGQYGGTRQGVAEGLGQQALADAMQRQTTGMRMQGYESGLNRYFGDLVSQRSALGNFWAQAPGTLGAYGSALMAPQQVLGQLATLQGNIGAQQQAMNQARLAEARQNWDYMQTAPLNALQTYANIANSIAGQGNVMTQPNPNQQNPFVTGLGIASLTQGLMGNWNRGSPSIGSLPTGGAFTNPIAGARPFQL